MLALATLANSVDEVPLLGFSTVALDVVAEDFTDTSAKVGGVAPLEADAAPFVSIVAGLSLLALTGAAPATETRGGAAIDGVAGSVDFFMAVEMDAGAGGTPTRTAAGVTPGDVVTGASDFFSEGMDVEATKEELAGIDGATVSTLLADDRVSVDGADEALGSTLVEAPVVAAGGAEGMLASAVEGAEWLVVVISEGALEDALAGDCRTTSRAGSAA